MIRRERSGDDAEEKKDAEQGFDTRELEAARSLQAGDDRRECGEMSASSFGTK